MGALGFSSQILLMQHDAQIIKCIVLLVAIDIKQRLTNDTQCFYTSKYFKITLNGKQRIGILFYFILLAVK